MCLQDFTFLDPRHVQPLSWTSLLSCCSLSLLRRCGAENLLSLVAWHIPGGIALQFLWLSIHGRAEPVEQCLLLSQLRALLLPARAGKDLQGPSEDADSGGVYRVPKRTLGRQGE